MDPYLALLSVVIGLNILVIYVLWRKPVYLHNQTLPLLQLSNNAQCHIEPDKYPRFHSFYTQMDQENIHNWTHKDNMTSLPKQVQIEDPHYREYDTQTDGEDYALTSVTKAGTQTDDTEYFMAFYDHVQAQHQELLEAKIDFKHLVFNFDSNVT